jgi:hypothetical protein
MQLSQYCSLQHATCSVLALFPSVDIESPINHSHFHSLSLLCLALSHQSINKNKHQDSSQHQQHPLQAIIQQEKTLHNLHHHTLPFACPHHGVYQVAQHECSRVESS